VGKQPLGGFGFAGFIHADRHPRMLGSVELLSLQSVLSFASLVGPGRHAFARTEQ
jgi:hypothetical protein